MASTGWFLSRMELLVMAVVSAHILLCPYAKVEESFNMQATHDLLIQGVRHVDRFDHLEFPGVVPRTFLGAIVVSLLSSPFAWLLQSMHAPKIYLQYLTRWMLGMLLCAALFMFKRRIAAHFGKDVARFFMLISACQFHLMFYMSRTLPNVYALALVLLAFGFWIESKWKYTICLMTFTTIAFRGDTAVLFAPILLSMLFSGRISIAQIIASGLMASIVSLALTIGIDSFFWKRWLWPEGEVLWFNTVLNKSHEWGVMPPFWYFYSALPRALLATMLLLPFGLSSLVPALVRSRSLDDIKQALAVAPIVDSTVWTFFWPILMYLALFSFLPHKELRFIFNAIPIFNMASAVGLAKLYRDRHKSVLPFLGAIGCLLLTVVGSIVFTMASHANYPGGHAFAQLHALASHEQHLVRMVHIDVPAAMTGVSRFGEAFPLWTYSKDESIKTEAQLLAFDYVLTAIDPTTFSSSQFQVLATVPVFDRVQVAVPPKIHTRPYIYVLRNEKQPPTA